MLEILSHHVSRSSSSHWYHWSVPISLSSDSGLSMVVGVPKTGASLTACWTSSSVVIFVQLKCHWDKANLAPHFLHVIRQENIYSSTCCRVSGKCFSWIWRCNFILTMTECFCIASLKTRTLNPSMWYVPIFLFDFVKSTWYFLSPLNFHLNGPTSYFVYTTALLITTPNFGSVEIQSLTLHFIWK